MCWPPEACPTQSSASCALPAAAPAIAPRSTSCPAHSWSSSLKGSPPASPVRRSAAAAPLRPLRHVTFAPKRPASQPCHTRSPARARAALPCFLRQTRRSRPVRKPGESTAAILDGKAPAKRAAPPSTRSAQLQPDLSRAVHAPRRPAGALPAAQFSPAPERPAHALRGPLPRRCPPHARGPVARSPRPACTRRAPAQQTGRPRLWLWWCAPPRLSPRCGRSPSRRSMAGNKGLSTVP
jgi:hypothetical protein